MSAPIAVRFEHNFLGGLLLAQVAEHSMKDESLRGPRAKLHLRDELWPDKPRVPGILGRELFANGLFGILISSR